MRRKILGRLFGRDDTDPRLSRLDERHVKPLMELVTKIRQLGFVLPNVDPNDGGIAARVLILLETPGPKAVSTTFVSRDNPDPSARNMGASLDIAQLARKDVVLWNVVPHCLSSPDQNRNCSSRDIRRAAPDTQEFINLLPNLRAILFCGNAAKKALRWLVIPTTITVFKTAHTGAQAYNRAHLRSDIHQTFRAAAKLLNSAGESSGQTRIR
jgi:hypothetical protein